MPLTCLCCETMPRKTAEHNATQLYYELSAALCSPVFRGCLACRPARAVWGIGTQQCVHIRAEALPRHPHGLQWGTWALQALGLDAIATGAHGVLVLRPLIVGSTGGMAPLPPGEAHSSAGVYFPGGLHYKPGNGARECSSGVQEWGQRVQLTGAFTEVFTEALTEGSHPLVGR